jgi:16S rRNA (guanine527-N7)-methyltransferase
LPPAAAERLDRLLAALVAEPDPPTTVREPPEAVDAHVADSLAGLEVPELREAARIADVGSGAGFPGLPLAIALPEARLDLIESTRRKCQVIDRLAAAAGLENARGVPRRAEEWAATEGAEAYEAVTARAVAPLAVLLEYASPLLTLGGVLVGWKGTREGDEETAGLKAAAELGMDPAGVIPVEPFQGARDRHLHVFVKREPTPPRFPRRPGMARKRPLA